MNTLSAELRRLFGVQAAAADAPLTEADLVGADGRVRALVVELARPAQWHALAPLWRGVQQDLDWPAPAIAVSGVDGHQLWFSLAEAVSLVQAQACLNALRARYLGDVPAARVGLYPRLDGANHAVRHAPWVPAVQAGTGMWSAFVAPDLAAIFSDEPWLELEPSAEAQAKVLSGVACIPQRVFQDAQTLLAPTATAVAAPASASQGAVAQAAKDLAIAANGDGPRHFLLGVMRDTRVDLPLRIEAAKALLPYCEG